MYKNLNHFIERLESEGELIRIDCKVSTQYEIAEITDRISKNEGGGKALLFENSGTGFPVLTNMMGSDRRIALALGVDSLSELSARIDSLLHDALSPKNGLMDKLRMLPMLAEMSKWLPRTSSSKGECQQVVVMGDELSLDKLPILKCWPHDGGHFVTLPMVNTVDPQSGVRNVGMYRMQVFDNVTTGMHWHIHKTGARHYEGYKKLGQRMPVSVAIGGDPAYTYAATAPMPDNMDEYLLAGFIRRKPVKLIKSITNDIYIPSDCDFVIEGYVDPAEEKVTEGAFGDHTGFYSLTDLYPRFHVTAITHRKDAIYPATLVGIPPQEDAYIAKATEKIFLAPIRLAIQPEVEDLMMPTAGTAHNIAITSISQRYVGQARKVAQGLWGAGQMMFNKYLMLADAAVDIHDPKMLARLIRRLDIEKNIIFSEGVLDVLDHATATLGYGGKMAIDATQVDPSILVESIEHSDSLDCHLLDEWGIAVAYAEESDDVVAPRGVKYLAIFDRNAEGATDQELLWLAAANTDPQRDIRLKGGTMIINARSKRPGAESNPCRFPNVVTSSVTTISLVDSRWNDYGVGEFVESPSNHYSRLVLSNSEQW